MPAGYDPRSRPWYKDAVAAGGLTLTEPYVDAATQELIITAATPVKAAGNTLGVVGGDLSLKTLVQIINSLDFSGMGYAFLVSGDGKILVHPDKEQVMKTLSEVYPQNTPKIATGFSEAELHGHTRILAFTPIKGLPSVTWYLALSIDKDKAYAMLSKFRVSAIAAALISIVAILVLLGLLIRLLMQPLHLMGRAMQDIAQGEGDLTKRLAVTSRDELECSAMPSTSSSSVSIARSGSRRDRAQTARRLATGGERLELFDGQLRRAVQPHQQRRRGDQRTRRRRPGNRPQRRRCLAPRLRRQPPGRRRQAGGRADHPRDERAFREDQRLLRQHRGPQQPYGEHRPDPRSDQGHLRADQPARPQRRHRSRARGEAGRGFAVVADEVRNLAHRAQESAQQIQKMIEELQVGAREAVATMTESQRYSLESVEIANRAGESLSSVTRRIGEIDG